MASTAAAESSSRLGSARKREEIWAIDSGRLRRCTDLTKSEGLRPAHAERAARLAASGRRPCAIRVRVDALTPVSLATCFHGSPLAVTLASSAL